MKQVAARRLLDTHAEAEFESAETAPRLSLGTSLIKKKKKRALSAVSVYCYALISPLSSQRAAARASGDYLRPLMSKLKRAECRTPRSLAPFAAGADLSLVAEPALLRRCRVGPSGRDWGDGGGSTVAVCKKKKKSAGNGLFASCTQLIANR